MKKHNVKDGMVYESVEEGSERTRYLLGNEKRVLIRDAVAILNAPTNIPVVYQLFDLQQGNYVTDTSVNKTVDIHLDYAPVGTEDIINGVGNIVFESAEVGTFKIKVENTSCEVIVNG